MAIFGTIIFTVRIIVVANVMFLHLSVSHSVHRGVYPSMHWGRHVPACTGADTPLQADMSQHALGKTPLPPGRHPSMHWGRHPTPGRHVPACTGKDTPPPRQTSQHALGQTPHSRQTCPSMHWERHPSPQADIPACTGADTPHPWADISQHALGQTPPPPPTAITADGTHPTGMYSCFTDNLTGLIAK